MIYTVQCDNSDRWGVRPWAESTPYPSEDDAQGWYAWDTRLGYCDRIRQTRKQAEADARRRNQEAS